MNKIKTSYSLFLTLCLTACSLFSGAQKQNAKGFVIDGYINGVEDSTKVYLRDIDTQIDIDSALTVNGKFLLKGHVEEPSSCHIKCGDEYAIVMVENTKMEFRSPLKNMRLEAAVKGGKEQQLENQLTALQRPYEKVYFAAYDSLMQEKFRDKDHKKALVKRFNAYQDSAQQVYVAFGKHHPNSYVGLDIIYRNRQVIGKDSIKVLYEKLDRGLKSTAKGQALHTFIYSELSTKGKKFIDFEAQTISGTPFKLSSLKGNYIVLNFWSAGCTFCRYENRAISKDYGRFKDKVQFVNFSLDERKDAWLAASKVDGIVWTNVSDGKGSKAKTPSLYDVQATPATFVINKDGIIIEKIIGFNADYLAQIEKLVSEGQTP
jgi:peroxiredoxin